MPSRGPATMRAMPARTRVTPVTLTDRRIRMGPLAERHLDDLARVAFETRLDG